MSRAFVKENDLEHAGIDIPEKPISTHPNYVTPNGLQEINQSIKILEAELEGIKKNDDATAKQKKFRIERDLRYFFARLKSAILVDPQTQTNNQVLFAAHVEVENTEGKVFYFKIVGEDEANISLDKISYISPLAKALIGAKIGDEVVWNKPSGDEVLIINKISYFE